MGRSNCRLLATAFAAAAKWHLFFFSLPPLPHFVLVTAVNLQVPQPAGLALEPVHAEAGKQWLFETPVLRKDSSKDRLEIIWEAAIERRVCCPFCRCFAISFPLDFF